jgi:hypothetical protein
LATVPSSDAASPIKVLVEVIGGLPVGSTPEQPEGTEYDEVLRRKTDGDHDWRAILVLGKRWGRRAHFGGIVGNFSCLG